MYNVHVQFARILIFPTSCLFASLLCLMCLGSVHHTPYSCELWVFASMPVLYSGNGRTGMIRDEMVLETNSFLDARLVLVFVASTFSHLIRIWGYGKFSSIVCATLCNAWERMSVCNDVCRVNKCMRMHSVPVLILTECSLLIGDSLSQIYLLLLLERKYALPHIPLSFSCMRIAWDTQYFFQSPSPTYSHTPIGHTNCCCSVTPTTQCIVILSNIQIPQN